MGNLSPAGNLQLGSTGLQAGAQLWQSRYEGAALRQNEILAARQAQSARLAGAAESTELRRQGKQVAGAQRVALAANNVDPSTSRSAQNVLLDTLEQSEMDAATALNNASQTAQALETEAAQKRADRKALRRFAPLAVGSTLLTGGSRAYGIHKKLTEF